MFCTLNYNIYYTLHPNFKFAVNLDGKTKVYGTNYNWKNSLG